MNGAKNRSYSYALLLHISLRGQPDFSNPPHTSGRVDRSLSGYENLTYTDASNARTNRHPSYPAQILGGYGGVWAHLGTPDDPAAGRSGLTCNDRNSSNSHRCNQNLVPHHRARRTPPGLNSCASGWRQAWLLLCRSINSRTCDRDIFDTRLHFID